MVRVILFSLRLPGEWPHMVRDRGEIWIVRFSGGGRVLTARIIFQVWAMICACVQTCAGGVQTVLHIRIL